MMEKVFKIAFYLLSFLSVGFSQNDSCQSYTEIDDPTRSVSYGNVDTLCDSNINLVKGWYRFVGSAGNGIPTSCVAAYSCNTKGPMWMNGELPSLGEGEVSRTACGSWANNCCNWATNIKVKQCAGGYYVYYLKNIGNCYYRYCVDHVNVTPATTTPATTVTSNLDSSASPNPETWVVCTEDRMQIDVKMNNVTNSYAYLDDHSCSGTYNGTHIILTTGLNQCGTRLKFPSATDVMYYNHVWYMEPAADGDVFSRSGEISVLVECTYSRKQALSVGSFSPNYNVFNTFVQGFGDITFSMSMYKAGDFEEQYAADDYPVKVDVGQTLYVQVSAHSSTPDLELLIDSCKASASSNPLDTSALTVQLIANGCPIDDTAVEYIESNSSFAKRFSFEAFVFLDRSSEVYLHCEAILCSASDPRSVCDLDCVDQSAELKRRSTSRLEEAERNIITIGPFTSGTARRDISDGTRMRLDMK